jgi:hypothetical protein
MEIVFQSYPILQSDGQRRTSVFPQQRGAVAVKGTKRTSRDSSTERWLSRQAKVVTGSKEEIKSLLKQGFRVCGYYSYLYYPLHQDLELYVIHPHTCIHACVLIDSSRFLQFSFSCFCSFTDANNDVQVTSKDYVRPPFSGSKTAPQHARHACDTKAK